MANQPSQQPKPDHLTLWSRADALGVVRNQAGQVVELAFDNSANPGAVIAAQEIVAGLVELRKTHPRAPLYARPKGLGFELAGSPGSYGSFSTTASESGGQVTLRLQVNGAPLAVADAPEYAELRISDPALIRDILAQAQYSRAKAEDPIRVRARAAARAGQQPQAPAPAPEEEFSV